MPVQVPSAQRSSLVQASPSSQLTSVAVLQAVGAAASQSWQSSSGFRAPSSRQTPSM